MDVLTRGVVRVSAADAASHARWQQWLIRFKRQRAVLAGGTT
jgi:hypothetical protein